VLGFLWGAFQYLDAREREIARQESERNKQAETRRIEATRPYLERQLKLYTEATRVASRIATADYDSSHDAPDDFSINDVSDETVSINPLARFWELYWGELALVEDRRVEGAMKAFGDALIANASADTLQRLSLSLAHACRESLAESWGVEQWQRSE
jgi:hypothetical protein